MVSYLFPTMLATSSSVVASVIALLAMLAAAVVTEGNQIACLVNTIGSHMHFSGTFYLVNVRYSELYGGTLVCI